MAINPKRRVTPEEYLEIDRASEERYEYFAGEMFLMSGGSGRHNTIIFNINTSLGAQIRGGRCRGYSNSQRVLVDRTGLYTYPDIVIVCGEPVYAHGDTLTNPTLIVEVLSPSTENYDKGKKFDHYRRIPTFVEYLLVAQDRVNVQHHVKEENRWWMEEFEGLTDEIHLPSVRGRLPLSDVYDNVEFDVEEQGNIH